MKKVTMFILGLAILIYVLIGGAVMMALESTNESDTKTSTRSEYLSFIASKTCVTTEELETFIKVIINAYDQGIIATNQTDSAPLWDYANSVFFAMTAVTTIGYGNQTPSTSRGRAFIAIFALIGIPAVAVFLSALGEKILNLSKSFQGREIWKTHPVAERRLKMFIIPTVGVVLILLIPAGIFRSIEGWSYAESLYYVIITLTTIGFGDYVLGTNDTSYRIVYRLLTAVWIMVGLAYVACLITHGSSVYTDLTTRAESKIEEKKGKHKGETEDKDEDKGETNVALAELEQGKTSS